MVSGFATYLVGVVKIIKCGKAIVFNGLNWVGIEFLESSNEVGTTSCSTILVI